MVYILFVECYDEITCRMYFMSGDIVKMRRYFNTEGQCEADIHYMVNLDGRLRQIKEFLVDRGKYFVINRGRQYGKTTTLRALADYLKEDYTVISLDFQKIGTEEFQDTFVFTRAFARLLMSAYAVRYTEDAAVTELIGQLGRFARRDADFTLGELFAHISRICEVSSKPVVMMIDEVDSASNNQVFVDFLAFLRSYYLDRKNKPTFWSVILAGVYDVRNLKMKMRPDAEHQYNSPWNIAADFDINMSFAADEIAAMLREYEEDHHTGMDINEIAARIYEYTSGYPYLVSRICKSLDERVPQIQGFENPGFAWTKEGITEAVKLLLKENTSLFDSMVKQLDLYPDLRKMIEDLLYQGKSIPFSLQVKSVNLGCMFGFLKEEKGRVAIANRIFEMVLLNMFIAQEAIDSAMFRCGEYDKNQFTVGGRLNMKLVLLKFSEHFGDIYGDNDEMFVEEYGRRLFLLYLKPIINGVGNYYLEAQTRDAKRTDVIVDYLGEQFVVELKIWHGNEYNQRGEEQLAGYLDYFHLKQGYMISLNFNKRKETGVKEILLGDRRIIEAVV